MVKASSMSVTMAWGMSFFSTIFITSAFFSWKSDPRHRFFYVLCFPVFLFFLFLFSCFSIFLLLLLFLFLFFFFFFSSFF